MKAALEDSEDDALDVFDDLIGLVVLTFGSAALARVAVPLARAAERADLRVVHWHQPPSWSTARGQELKALLSRSRDRCLVAVGAEDTVAKAAATARIVGVPSRTITVPSADVSKAPVRIRCPRCTAITTVVLAHSLAVPCASCEALLEPGPRFLRHHLAFAGVPLAVVSDF